MRAIGLVVVAVLCGFVRSDGNPELTDNKINVLIEPGKDTKFELNYYTTKKFSQTGSPILFHLTFGDDAKNVANQEAFIFDIAQQLNATLVVVESRFYGQSNVTQVTDQLASVATLTPENMLADVKAVIMAVRKNEKVYVSGAGIAGELAVMLQIQEKDLISGSIVSNAHLKLHQGSGLELGAFDKKLNEIYKTEGCNMDNLKNAFAAFDSATTPDDTKKITDTLKLDESVSFNKPELRDYLHAAYVGLPLQNFDIEHEFTIPGRSVVNKFGKRPLKAYCDSIKNSTGDKLEQKLDPLAKLIEAFYQKSDLNDDGTKHCYLSNQLPKDFRLNAIKCTTLAEYSCAQGAPDDFFTPDANCKNDADWQRVTRTKCVSLFKDYKAANLQPDYMKTKTNNFNFKDLKNVIFIDGEYDTGSVGGVTEVETQNDQYQYTIKGVTRFAHLLQASTCDSDNLKQLRYQVINILKCWVTGTNTGDCDRSKLKSDLKEYVAQNSGVCTPQVLSYPWGQDPRDPGKGSVSSTTPSSFAVTGSSISLITQFLLLSSLFFIFNDFRQA